MDKAIAIHENEDEVDEDVENKKENEEGEKKEKTGKAIACAVLECAGKKQKSNDDKMNATTKSTLDSLKDRLGGFMKGSKEDEETTKKSKDEKSGEKMTTKKKN